VKRNCDAKIQGLEIRHSGDVSYCRLPVDATGSHSGPHVATLRDERVGWWFGTMRGLLSRSGELYEMGGG
jgi:hypothetical protein